MDNYQAIKKMVSKIVTYVYKIIDTAPYDKSFRAPIVSKNGNQYQVQHKGNKYKVYSSLNIPVGTWVTICVPQNDWSNLYIIGAENSFNSEPIVSNISISVPHSGDVYMSQWGNVVIVTFNAFYLQTAGNAQILYSEMPINAMPQFALENITCDGQANNTKFSPVFIKPSSQLLVIHEYYPNVIKYGTLVYLTK